jgi:hypothetical protein
MMKHLKLLLFTLCCLLLSVHQTAAQPEGRLPDAITMATRNGDAFELSTYFNSKIELVLPNKSGVFSKEQAQFLIKDFFQSYPPVSFQIIHQGVRENATFAIGRYNYNTGQYRIVFLTKNTGNQTFIHQIRVERQDD